MWRKPVGLGAKRTLTFIGPEYEVQSRRFKVEKGEHETVLTTKGRWQNYLHNLQYVHMPPANQSGHDTRPGSAGASRNRREFIRTAAIAGAGLSMLEFGTGLSPAVAQDLSGSNNKTAIPLGFDNF